MSFKTLFSYFAAFVKKSILFFSLNMFMPTTMMTEDPAANVMETEEHGEGSSMEQPEELPIIPIITAVGTAVGKAAVGTGKLVGAGAAGGLGAHLMEKIGCSIM